MNLDVVSSHFSHIQNGAFSPPHPSHACREFYRLEMALMSKDKLVIAHQFCTLCMAEGSFSSLMLPDFVLSLLNRHRLQ